jgi:hypothetical protein
VIATIPHLSSVPSVNGSSTSQMIISSRMIATYPGGHGVFLIRSHLLRGVVGGPRRLRDLRAEELRRRIAPEFAPSCTP